MTGILMFSEIRKVTKRFCFGALFCLIGGMLLFNCRIYAAESALTVLQSEKEEGICLESGFFSLKIGADGQVLNAIERKTGKDWLAPGGGQFFALINMKKNDQAILPEKVTWVEGAEGKKIKIFFRNQTEVILNYESFQDFFTLEVDSVNSDFYRIEFGRVTLAPDYSLSDAFGFSSLILTIQTNVVEYPGKATRLGARCYGEIGAVGAKAAFVAVPENQMRNVMKSVTEMILAKSSEDPEYWKIAPPVSRNGGGFAKDNQKNRGSYIITSYPLTAEEVPQWAEHLARFGVNQIDFHQGNPYRQGDFVFKESAYPNGITDFRRMTDELKKHGMMAGLHTYSEFVVGGSKYLTPVPHNDLDIIRYFTLSRDIDETENEIPVEESTREVSLICGYTIRNSLYLKIDSEIIGFHDLTPNGFTKCERGAFGTKAASHAKGARVGHLTRFFNSYFAPNPKSELFLEIARNTAKTYDEGGFSMIYLDALDGTSSIVEDRELAWYYDALFVREILRNIKSEPPLLEYSTMSPSLWAARSRMGAWDSPVRGYLNFFDWHFESNLTSAVKCYLPGQMGWFAVCPSRVKSDYLNFQTQTLYREHLDYLGAKCLGHDHGLSYLDISPGTLVPAAFENGKRLSLYDTLRRENYFTPEIREMLKEPGKHFRVVKEGEKYLMKPAEYWTFRPTLEKHTFMISNSFGKQKPYLRIENLYAVEAYDSPEAMELIPFDGNAKAQSVSAKNIEDPFMDLRAKQGLGLWIFGDGQGQIVNVRVESPYFKLSGVADHYAKIDHKGWKYFEFAELENGDFRGTRWPAGRSGLYVEYRQSVKYDSISGIYVMINGPADGLRFRTLKALPLRETELKDPVVAIAGTEIILKGTIPSGCYAEIVPETDKILVKDPVGNVVGELSPSLPIPELADGESEVKISFSQEAPRTRWTIGVYGK